jgi:tetratricopeptide (TPR) repeat protein
MSSVRVALLACLLALGAGTPEARADDRKERALALWKEGVARYDLGRFDQAIDLFEKAYEVHPYPEILFNLGQAHRQKKGYERAIFFFRAYLRNKPRAENRQEVAELIAEMEQLLEAQRSAGERPPEGVEDPPRGAVAPAAAVTPAPQPPPPEPPPARGDGLEWGLTVGGGVVAAGGVGALLHGAGLRRDADRALDQSDAEALRGRADLWQIGGVVGVAAGAGLAIAGVLRFGSGDRPAAGASARLELEGNWVFLRGEF